ncbi:tRNA (adenine(22)-N(1))-methyltransferase [Lentibacillus sediminis]|uniref:tRNA (adenine(22)-N(1))-methyltransferase n=1 Tax=Lentibacillus sediminis TaxID=1940529 RepID=UPI000C1BE41A|nr:class I SAM-dependent methyltransferase [Lentibacillus sediminis]
MTNTVRLSRRLQAVADYLPTSAYFADIGSDHAYLPCYVCLRDKTARAIAGEVKQGPWQRASDTVKQYGMEQKVDVRLGDGMEILSPGEAKQIVIAGMGGSLIANILEEGKEKLENVKRIIAQPNVDARNTRRWLQKNGFAVTDEVIIEEHGHIYEIIAADRHTENDPYEENQLEQQLLFGPVLLNKRPDAFYRKWEEEYSKLQFVMQEMKKAKTTNAEKMEEFSREAKWIREVLQK